MRAALAALVLAAALVAPAAAPARGAWFSTAEARCAQATREGKVLVATIDTLETQADVLGFMHDGVDIGARLHARLRAAGPPPAARRFVSLLGQSVALDRKSVAALDRGVTKARIQRWLDAGQWLEAAARREAARIGLRACAAYLDPATYK